jgi:hypothetical protein
MNELRDGFEELARRHDRHDECQHPLDIVAQNWSQHAGRTYTGKLLRKAQKISAAMWEFTASLQKISPAQHERDCLPEEG